MRFARADYDRRIIDVAGKIPEDEPVWLLRAQDAAAPDTLDAWAYQHELRGGDRTLAYEARIVAQEMREWQASHGKKTADVPSDPDADLPDREVPVELPHTSGQFDDEDHTDAPDDQSIEEALEQAVREGHMEHAGVDEHGDPLYRLTSAGRKHVEDNILPEALKNAPGQPNEPSPKGA